MSISRLLLVRADRIGDLMHVTPLLAALHEQIPGLSVDVLAKSPAASILTGNPVVRRVLDARWDDAHLSAAIAEGDYNAVAHLFPEKRLITLCQGIPRSSRRGLLPWFGRHRRVVLHRSQNRKSESLYNADLVKAWFPNLKVDPRPRIFPPQASQDRAKILMPTPRPLINPGSGHPEGAWPWERFAAVARELTPQYGKPLVVWGPGEEALATKVATQGNAELAPATDLLELAALAARCSVMVTNDTGPMHLGAAAGAPMVVIWDGSPAIRPLRWGHFFRPDIVNLDPHDGSSGATHDRQRRLATISAETVLTQVQRIIRK